MSVAEEADAAPGARDRPLIAPVSLRGLSDAVGAWFAESQRQTGLLQRLDT